MKKRTWIIIIIALTLIIGVITFSILRQPVGKIANTGQPIRYVPLTQEEINKVAQTIVSSEFIKDVPEKNPIALVFFNFENGERVQQDAFLIGKNQLLNEGTPSIYLILHSKYISQLNENNICDVIKQANRNGDLGFQSDYNTASLLLKYTGMLKHRSCFGF